MESFLDEIPTFLNVVPKHSRPDKESIVDDIREKSRVLFFPLSIERNRFLRCAYSDTLHTASSMGTR